MGYIGFTSLIYLLILTFLPGPLYHHTYNIYVLMSAIVFIPLQCYTYLAPNLHSVT